MTSTPNITPAQETAMSDLIGRMIDELIAEFGDIETAARKVATYMATEVAA